MPTPYLFLNRKHSDVIQTTEVDSTPSNTMQDHEKLYDNISINGTGKGKAISLQAWTGPEGSRRLRLPDFKIIDT
jgi:hypothetical protein